MKVTIEIEEEQLVEMLTEHLAKRNVKYLGHEFRDDDQLVVRGELGVVLAAQGPVQPSLLRLPSAPVAHVPAAQPTPPPQPPQAAPQPLEGGTRSIVAPDRANLRNGDSGGPRLSLTDMHDVPAPSATKGEVLSHKQDIHETALSKRGLSKQPLEELSADMRLDDGGESEIVGDEEGDDGDFSDILSQMRQLPDNPLKGTPG